MFCRTLFFTVIAALILPLNLHAAQIVQVVKNADGSLNQMAHSPAIVYCSRLKARLMTSRELAEYGVAHGAAGIRETAYPNAVTGDKQLMQEWQANQAAKYYAVTKQTAPEWSTRVDFYYNGAGYESQELPDGRYWAAEVAPSGSDVANVFQTGTKDSNISYMGRTNTAGVVCVR